MSDPAINASVIKVNNTVSINIETPMTLYSNLCDYSLFDLNLMLTYINEQLHYYLTSKALIGIEQTELTNKMNE